MSDPWTSERRTSQDLHLRPLSEPSVGRWRPEPGGNPGGKWGAGKGLRRTKTLAFTSKTTPALTTRVSVLKGRVDGKLSVAVLPGSTVPCLDTRTVPLSDTCSLRHSVEAKVTRSGLQWTWHLDHPGDRRRRVGEKTLLIYFVEDVSRVAIRPT